jgi:hypothetical protein
VKWNYIRTTSDWSQISLVFYAGLYCISYSHNNNIYNNNHFTVIYNYFYWQFSNWQTTYIFVKFDIQYLVGLIFWQNQYTTLFINLYCQCQQLTPSFTVAHICNTQQYLCMHVNILQYTTIISQCTTIFLSAQQYFLSAQQYFLSAQQYQRLDTMGHSI